MENKILKFLYEDAKISKSNKPLWKYEKHLNMLENSNPIEYISNLEYIIKSSIGLESFTSFCNNKTIPLSYYNESAILLQEAINECEKKNINPIIFENALNDINSIIESKSHIIAMDNYFNENNNHFLKMYYEFFPNIKSNIKIVDKLLNRYGESCVPNLLHYAYHNDLLKETVDVIISNDIYNNPKFNQWLYEVCKDFKLDLNNILTLENVINKLNYEHNSELQRSIIMESTPSIVYTENDINDITDLISFKEYMLISSNNISEINKLQSEIYSLYESIDWLLEEDVANNVLSMLPTNKTKIIKSDDFNELDNYEESKWLSNTHNKKTGSMPDYIKNNHDLNYGEDDKPSSDEDESIDDYKRKTDEDDTPSTSTYDDSDDENDTPINNTQTPSSTSANNYYYYTYNNSHNKNTNSFNKDNSVNNDSHNISNTNINNSKNVDDHSNNKRINSNDIKENFNMSMFEYKLFSEEVGDADDNKPKSDHPIKDTLTDIDRKLTQKGQAVKKKSQDVKNAGKAFIKPTVRTAQYITSMVAKWKDADENNIKERLADPHARNNLFGVIKKAIAGGSLLKAGLLLNPIFLFLTVTRGVGKNKKEFRIRNEMIGEIKAEIEIVETKIQDAANNGDNSAKYKLMRFKNELTKKLIRVGGTKEMSKIL